MKLVISIWVYFLWSIKQQFHYGEAVAVTGYAAEHLDRLHLAELTALHTFGYLQQPSGSATPEML